MAKKQISAREVLQDIREGLSDEALMNKFGLSSDGLMGLFQKMKDAGLLTQKMLDDRNQDFRLEMDVTIASDGRGIQNQRTNTGRQRIRIEVSRFETQKESSRSKYIECGGCRTRSDVSRANPKRAGDVVRWNNYRGNNRRDRGYCSTDRGYCSMDRGGSRCLQYREETGKWSLRRQMGILLRRLSVNRWAAYTPVLFASPSMRP